MYQCCSGWKLDSLMKEHLFLFPILFLKKIMYAFCFFDELGDFTAELKLSLFQLGISRQIAASILMQSMGRTKRKALLAALDKTKEDLKRSHLCTLLRKKTR